MRPRKCPGNSTGRVTSRNTWNRVAPRSKAASSSAGSKLYIWIAITRVTTGTIHTRCANTAVIQLRLDAERIEPQQQRQPQDGLRKEDRQQNEALVPAPPAPLVTRERQGAEEAEHHGNGRHQDRDGQGNREQLADLDRGKGLLPPVEPPLGDRELKIAAGRERGERDAHARQINEYDDRHRPYDDENVPVSMPGSRRVHFLPRKVSRSNRLSTMSTSVPTTSIRSTESAAPSGQFCA